MLFAVYYVVTVFLVFPQLKTMWQVTNREKTLFSFRSFLTDNTGHYYNQWNLVDELDNIIDQEHKLFKNAVRESAFLTLWPIVLPYRCIVTLHRRFEEINAGMSSDITINRARIREEEGR